MTSSPMLTAPKTSKRPERQLGTLRPWRIEIPIPAKPRYVPGIPPPRISLVPRRDSTAYILNKSVFPLLKDSNKSTKRRLLYTIGWTDLPAARMTLDATRVLDYVSPAALEDFEYQDMLKREEDEQKLAETDTQKRSLKRKRGRPAKARLAELEDEDARREVARELSPKRVPSGPSLSTPQKRPPRPLLEQYQDTEDETLEEARDESDDAVALFRQLNGAAAPRRDMFEDMDVDESVAMGEAHGPARLRQKPGFTDKMVVDFGAGDLFISAMATSAAGSSSRASSLAPPAVRTAPASTPAATRASTSSSPTLSQVRRQDQALEAAKRSQLSVSHKAQQTLTSWLVGHTQPPIMPKLDTHSSSQIAKGISREENTETRPHHRLSRQHSAVTKAKSDVVHPEFKLQTNTPQQHVAKETPFHSEIPVRFTPVQHTLSNPSSIKQTATGTVSIRPAFSKGFTPLGLNPDSVTGTPTSKPKKRKKTENAMPTEQPTEQEWAVKRLEGFRESLNDDGTANFQYRVRWDGDWPPDQNPTWEPEENLPAPLVRQFWNKKARKAGDNPDQLRKAARSSAASPWPLKRKYSNVAEAFEGDIDQLDNQFSSDANGNDLTGDVADNVDGGDAEDEFQVIEDAGTDSSSHKFSWNQSGQSKPLRFSRH